MLRIVADTMTLSIEGCQAIAVVFPRLEVLELSDRQGKQKYGRGDKPIRGHRSERAAPLEGITVIVRGYRNLVDLGYLSGLRGCRIFLDIPRTEEAPETIAHVNIPLGHGDETLVAQDHELRVAAESYRHCCLLCRQ